MALARAKQASYCLQINTVRFLCLPWRAWTNPRISNQTRASSRRNVGLKTKQYFVRTLRGGVKLPLRQFIRNPLPSVSKPRLTWTTFRYRCRNIFEILNSVRYTTLASSVFCFAIALSSSPCFVCLILSGLSLSL